MLYLSCHKSERFYILFIIYIQWSVLKYSVLKSVITYILVLLLCLIQLSNTEYSILFRNWNRTKILSGVWSTCIILEHLLFAVPLYEQVKDKSQSPPWDRPPSVPQISQRLCISTEGYDSSERVVSASYKNLKFSYN